MHTTLRSALLLALAASTLHAQSPVTVRAMIYNIEQGMGHEGRTIGGEQVKIPLVHWSFHVPKIPIPLAPGDHFLDKEADDIRQQAPDVAMLQEVDVHCVASLGYDQGEHVAKALGMHMIFETSTTNGGGALKTQGDAVLSKYPIDQHKVILINEKTGPFERRIAVAAHIADPRVPGGWWAVSVHMAPGDWAAVGQTSITNLVAGCEALNGPIVVGGDFNTHPGSEALDAIDQYSKTAGRRLTDAWVEAGTGPDLTSGWPEPVERGDFIYHSPELKAVKAWVPDNHHHSNHRPVVADLSVQPSAPTTVAAAPAGTGSGTAYSLLGVGGGHP